MEWRYRATMRHCGRELVFVSPDVRVDPSWRDEDLGHPIEQLEFFLPGGHVILMRGMEAFCFFLEVSESFSRLGLPRLEAVWLCGKLPAKNTVDMWRVGGGRIVRQQKPYGAEWGGTPVAGWKPGLTGTVSPVSLLIHGSSSCSGHLTLT